jgi:hypothetical protein
MPDCPIILLLGNAGFSGTGLPCGPANELIEGIDGTWWGLGELLQPVGMTERAKIEEHRHAPPCFLTMDEGLAHKEVGKPMFPIGRVRDDVLGKRFR